MSDPGYTGSVNNIQYNELYLSAPSAILGVQSFPLIIRFAEGEKFARTRTSLKLNRQLVPPQFLLQGENKLEKKNHFKLQIYKLSHITGYSVMC